MRISDWSSDVCSSDLRCFRELPAFGPDPDRWHCAGHDQFCTAPYGIQNDADDLVRQPRPRAGAGRWPLSVSVAWFLLMRMEGNGVSRIVRRISSAILTRHLNFTPAGFRRSPSRSEEQTSEIQSLKSNS